MTPLEAVLLETEIREHVQRLATRANQVFTTALRPSKVASATTWYLNGLRGKRGGEDGAADVATEMVEYLIDAETLARPQFWATGLGQALAWRIGYHEPVVPTEAARHILSMTRQALYDARKRKTLTAPMIGGIPYAGVTRESVRAYLRAQYGEANT